MGGRVPIYPAHPLTLTPPSPLPYMSPVPPSPFPISSTPPPSPIPHLPGLREAAEDRLSSLSSTNERSEWRQRVTHARFQEEMGAKGAMQERVLKAERGLTEATGELARLREEHRKLGRVYEELLTEGAGLRASVSRLEFERERLVGANRELETKGIEMQARGVGWGNGGEWVMGWCKGWRGW